MEHIIKHISSYVTPVTLYVLPGSIVSIRHAVQTVQVYRVKPYNTSINLTCRQIRVKWLIRALTVSYTLQIA